MADDDLPEWWDAVERVVVLHRRLAASVDEDEDLPNHVEATSMPGLRHNKVVAFDEGDDVPLSVAARAWPGFSERLAAFDADGTRLDDPHPHEQDNFSNVAHEV